jgi:hypothetical protein
LEQRVRDGIHLGARKLIDFIYEDVHAFTDGRGADDDITFFIIKAIEKKKDDSTTEVKSEKEKGKTEEAI